MYYVYDNQKYMLINGNAVVCKNKYSKTIHIPKSVNVGNKEWVVKFPDDLSGLFMNYRLEDFSIDMGVNTDNITNVSFMFYSCISLKRIDLRNFNFSNVSNAAYMFYHCIRLESIKLPEFSKRAIISNIFYSCKVLKSVKVRLGEVNDFDIHNCKMLSFINCEYGENISRLYYDFNEHAFIMM